MQNIRDKKYWRMYALIFGICLFIMLFLLHFAIKTTVGNKITEEKRNESNVGSISDTALTQDDLKDADKVQEDIEGMIGDNNLLNMFVEEEQSDNATEGQ